ncbi:hypothetical protein B0H13DRAFT_1859066 [Mycena leptocephala]|nr:hypothetical protein B0H13DRAFT_1859066 [Mycena leptocephala]
MLLVDVSRIDTTCVAWMNVDETKIYEILKGNIALLVFQGDLLTEFLIAKIFESIVGTAGARRLRKLFPSIRQLSESLTAVRETKEAWITCHSNDLTAFIFETLSQLTVGASLEFICFAAELRQMLGFPTVGKIGGQFSSPNGLILSEEKYALSLWNYRLKNKAAKLRALRIAVEEHLKNMSQGSDLDGDTLGADSRRQSAQILNVDLDELELEKTDVGM